MNLRKFPVKRIEPSLFTCVKCHVKVIGWTSSGGRPSSIADQPARTSIGSQVCVRFAVFRDLVLRVRLRSSGLPSMRALASLSLRCSQCRATSLETSSGGSSTASTTKITPRKSYARRSHCSGRRLGVQTQLIQGDTTITVAIRRVPRGRRARDRREGKRESWLRYQCCCIGYVAGGAYGLSTCMLLCVLCVKLTSPQPSLV